MYSQAFGPRQVSVKKMSMSIDHKAYQAKPEKKERVVESPVKQVKEQK